MFRLLSVPFLWSSKAVLLTFLTAERILHPQIIAQQKMLRSVQISKPFCKAQWMTSVCDNALFKHAWSCNWLATSPRCTLPLTWAGIGSIAPPPVTPIRDKAVENVWMYGNNITGQRKDAFWILVWAVQLFKNVLVKIIILYYESALK